ncbi:hypothetical protein [Actinotalea subterranea]|uniref:hypothetical protein n=1 Tax=Actinotalea subterranea TaxID=2607497 RepID=UPI0011EFC889|nr:hypothetical protein [Actinotalea subterranea]
MRSTSRERRSSRSARVRVVSAAGLLLLLTACAGTTQGQAFPDWEDLEERDAARFEAQLEALGTAINESSPFTTTAEMSVTGVSYVHAAYGERDSGSQAVVHVLGNPASIFIQQTDADAGYTIDTLHVGGQTWDYLLLGDGYASLAPTPWVQMPTIYGHPDEDPLTASLRTVCFIEGFQQMCEIHDTVVTTAESPRGQDMRASVTVEPDGVVRSETEVTLAAVIENNGLLHIPPEISSELTQAMLDSFIPVTLWQDADGMIIKVEMNGSVPGTDGADDFVVQAGFEITGTASPEDFPTPPIAWDTTVITDEQAIDDFYTKMGNL